MKIMKRMMSLAAAILALSACSESDDILSSFHNDPNAVHITAEVGKASADGFTRSNPLGDAQKQKQFNENDEISVKADGQEAVTYQFNGSEWVPQDSKFLKWESNEMNFTPTILLLIMVVRSPSLQNTPVRNHWLKPIS